MFNPVKCAKIVQTKFVIFGEKSNKFRLKLESSTTFQISVTLLTFFAKFPIAAPRKASKNWILSTEACTKCQYLERSQVVCLMFVL